MRVDLWELEPACNVFFLGIPIHRHRAWNTVVIQGIFGWLDDKLEATVFRVEEIAHLLGMMLLSLIWFSQGSVFSWGCHFQISGWNWSLHRHCIIPFTIKTRPLCHDHFNCVYSLNGFKILCISELWVTPLGSNGVTYKQDLCIFWRCWWPQRRWDLLTSVRTEGLLRAERIKRREALWTAGEIRRTSEKLQFEQSFGYKEMELGGDLEWGRYTKRQQQDW